MLIPAFVIDGVHTAPSRVNFCIEEAAELYPITKLCKLFNISRSGYYAYLKRKDIDRDADTKALIKEVYTKFNGVYGYRQIQMHLLQDDEERINHKKVHKFMQEMGFRSIMRQKRRQSYKTTAGARVAENLLERNFKAEKPNQKWVTIVMQYRVFDTWLYISTIKDLYNGELVAARCHRSQRKAS